MANQTSVLADRIIDTSRELKVLFEKNGTFNSYMDSLVGKLQALSLEIGMDEFRSDDDSDDEGNNGGGKGGGKGGGHGNTRLPFGLCQRFGIEIGKDWGPSEAWEALADKGITPKGAFSRLKRGYDPGDPSSDEDFVDISPIVAAAKKAGPEVHIKVYKEQKAKHEELEKRLKDKNRELADLKLFEVRERERELERAQKRIKEVEEKEQLIGGRNREQIAEDFNRADEEFKMWREEYKRLHTRPERGTPEREEWDKWVASKGGFMEYADKVSKETLSEEGAWGKLERERKALAAYQELMYYGGREEAEASVKRAEASLKAAKEKMGGLEKEISEMEKDVGESRESLERQRQLYEKAVKSKFPTYRDCKTTEDVVERLDCCGYFRYGSAKLDGVPLGGAIRIAEEVDEFFTKNPEMKGHLGPVKVAKLSSNVYGQSGGSVELNSAWYGDREKFERSYESAVRTRFHPEGTTYRSVVAHEYTHQLDDHMTYALDFGKTAGGRQKKFSSIVFAEVRKNLGMSAEECKQAVSRYAFKNKSGGAVEFLAEAYCEYLCSPSPRPVAMEVGKVVEKYLKKLGEKK